jgi:pyroglutamyl-peptidase
LFDRSAAPAGVADLKMSGTILLTGFGPFPGAPLNPTGLLVRRLARSRAGFGNARRIAHVFRTSYQAVDRELPALIKRQRPYALVMFGLARRARHIRIETHARNALAAKLPDASGSLPGGDTIAPGEAESMPLSTPALRLLAAARAAGLQATLSGDAGSYLCNYLCWRASEAAARPGGPRLVAFVHVPDVQRAVRPPRHRRKRRRPGSRVPRTLADLVAAGEAIVEAARATARVRR